MELVKKKREKTCKNGHERKNGMGLVFFPFDFFGSSNYTIAMHVLWNMHRKFNLECKYWKIFFCKIYTEPVVKKKNISKLTTNYHLVLEKCFEN